MKKIGAFLAAVAVLLGAGVSGSADPAPADGGTPPGSPVVPLSEDFTQVAASGFLRLGVDLRTANLAVWDSRENTVWYANPPELEGLELSQEMLRQLQFHIISKSAPPHALMHPKYSNRNFLLRQAPQSRIFSSPSSAAHSHERRRW